MIESIVSVGASLFFFGLWLFLFSKKNYYIIDLTKDLEWRPYFYNLLFLAIFILIVKIVPYIITPIIKKITEKLQRDSQEKQEKPKKFYEKFLEKFLNKVRQCYVKYNIFLKTYTIIFDWLTPARTKYIVRLAEYCLEFTTKKNISIIICFVVIPRMISLLVFISEIYMGILHYYFYSLLLNFIPLIFRFILFILSDLGPRVLPELKQFVVTDKVGEMIIETPEGDKTVAVMGLKPGPAAYPDLDFDRFMFDVYYPVLYIKGHMECVIMPLVSKITNITQIIYYIVQSIGLSYIIIYLL